MFSRIFIDRPRLAMVISIVITLAGLIALFNIPVAQYPEITPPEIQVTAVYPGANAKVVAEMIDVLAGTEQYQAGPENKFDPRRNYPVLLHSDPPPEFDLPVEWPTQDEIDLCLQEVELLGIVLYEGWIEDELPRAVDYLPMKWRVPGAMQFAMGAWMLERGYGRWEGTSGLYFDDGKVKGGGANEHARFCGLRVGNYFLRCSLF